MKYQSDLSASFDSIDIQANKVVAALSVFLPPLFFLPLIVCPGSKFAKFYANQGLILLILIVASWFLGIIPFIGALISWLVGVAVLVFAIIGLINAQQERAVTLPFIGDIQILK